MLDKNLVIGISLVLLWTFFDFRRMYLVPTSSINATQTSNEGTLPVLDQPIPKNITIKIRYCFTCGYRNNFEQFSELIHREYPDVSIIADNYPSSRLKTLLAKGLSLVKIALLITLLFSQNPFQFFRFPTPRIYHWALQNKIYACLMIFFLSNFVESYLLSTNAFEISINDIPLWSKLQTGRMPTKDEFIRIIQPFIS